MRILTYSDPFSIDKNDELWKIATNHPHFCASDTLMQGMVRQYGRESFKTIRAIDDFIKILFKSYFATPVNDMSLYLTVSEYIRSWPDSPIKQSFLFNKSEVVQAIHTVLPLELDPEEFDRTGLRQEQARFLDILNYVQHSPAYKPFSSLNDLNTNDVKKAVMECGLNEINHICTTDCQSDAERLSITLPFYSLDDAKSGVNKIVEALKKETEDDIWGEHDQRNERIIKQLEQASRACEMENDDYYKVIVVHGIHRISPIYFYLFKFLEDRGCEVVFVINYATNLPAVYGTWKKAYEWCDVPFEFEDKLNLSLGNQTAVDMALVLSGQKPRSDPPQKLIRFNNLTEFTQHEVANVYSKAASEAHTPTQILGKMRKQYYAVNGRSCNDILQMYYPEQFHDKPFLSYPVGQFILGLYNMWNFENRRVEFSYNSLCECAVSGLLQNSGNSLETLRKTQLFFYDVKTFEEYKARIKQLRAGAKHVGARDVYSGIEKVSFYSLTDDEINSLDHFITELNNISLSLFANMNSQVSYIPHFRQLMDAISSKCNSEGAMSLAEKKIIDDISTRLSVSEPDTISGNAEDIQDALAFFLTAKKRPDTSNWIVRDFNQLDGAVLLSRSTAARTYHFTLLSNEHMLTGDSEPLPWPLTERMFNNYSKYSQALSAITTAQKERTNYLRYLLFYASFFSSKNIEFSYIQEENGEEQTPYYLFDAIGMKIEQANIHESSKFMYAQPPHEIEIGNIVSSLESKEMFSVCPFKYFLFDVAKAPISYSSEFHIKYYLSFLVADVVRQSHKTLDEEMEKLQELFPFFGDTVMIDIKDMAKKQLQAYRGYTSEKIRRRKENFLIASWTDPVSHRKLDFEKDGTDIGIRVYFSESRVYPNSDELPFQRVCENCCYCDICLRNYYQANAENGQED